MSIARSFEFFVQWHLTERCNLRCRHCYQKGLPVAELSFDQIEAVVAEVAETVDAWGQTYEIPFTLSYNVTGGEPFLRPDFFKILESIAHRKSAIYVLTNGTLVTRELARKTVDAGAAGVQVSIEGPEKIHDAIRGRGSLRKALRGVDFLVSAGLTVTLNATLSQINAPYTADLVQIAKDCGVQRLGFARLVPSGRGEALSREMVDSAVLKALYLHLLSLQTEGLEIVIGDPLASRLHTQTETGEGYPNIASAGCAAAVSGVTLLSDGTMVPCRRLPIPIGNILEDSLRETWAASPVLNRLRDRNAYPGRCGKCRHWSVCRGCRAIAHASSRSRQDGLLDDDPQCFVEMDEIEA
jgi:AdoMet-dependent heme synthase